MGDRGHAVRLGDRRRILLVFMQDVEHQLGDVARNVQFAFLGIEISVLIFNPFFITNPDRVGVFRAGRDHPLILGRALRNAEFQAVAAPVGRAGLAVNRITAL